MPFGLSDSPFPFSDASLNNMHRYPKPREILLWTSVLHTACVIEMDQGSTIYVRQGSRACSPARKAVRQCSWGQF